MNQHSPINQNEEIVNEQDIRRGVFIKRRIVDKQEERTRQEIVDKQDIRQGCA